MVETGRSAGREFSALIAMCCVVDALVLRRWIARLITLDSLQAFDWAPALPEPYYNCKSKQESS